MNTTTLLSQLRKFRGTDCYITLNRLIETYLEETKLSILYASETDIPKLQGKGQFLEQLKKELAVDESQKNSTNQYGGYY